MSVPAFHEVTNGRVNKGSGSECGCVLSELDNFTDTGNVRNVMNVEHA